MHSFPFFLLKRSQLFAELRCSLALDLCSCFEPLCSELIVLDCLSGAIADESSSELSILLEELESRFQKRAAIIENRQA
jgi:hypothetical protein